MQIGDGPAAPGDVSALFPKLREAAAHTLIYGLGSVLQTSLGFILIPLYTRHFTPDTYGVLILLTLVGTFAGAVFYLGSTSALARSYYDYVSLDDRRVVVGTALRVALLGAAAQVLLGVAGGRALSLAFIGSATYAPHVVAALAGSALTFINAIFFMVLRFLRRSVLVIVLSLTVLVLTTGLIVYFLVWRDLGVMAPLLGTLLGQAVLMVALVVLTREHVSLRWSARELRVQLAFGLPAVVIGLTYYLLDSVDRFLLAHYTTLSDVGVYSLGYRIGMLIQIVLVLPFGQIWTPMRMEYRQDPGAPRLFRTIMTYYALIGMWIAVALAVFGREIILLVGGHREYLSAYRVVPFVALGHLVYGAINILDSGIIFTRKLMYHVYIFLLGLVANVGLNLLFIPRYGYMAAAAATLSSYLLVVAVVAVVSNRLYRVDLDHPRLLRIGVTGAIAAALGVLVPGSAGWMVAVKVLGVAVLTGVWYSTVLVAEERQAIQRLLRSIAGRRWVGTAPRCV